MKNAKIAILNTEESRAYSKGQRTFNIEGNNVTLGDLFEGSNVCEIIDKSIMFVPCLVKGVKPSKELLEYMAEDRPYIVLNGTVSKDVKDGNANGKPYNTSDYKGVLHVDADGVYLAVSLPYTHVLIREVNLYK